MKIFYLKKIKNFEKKNLFICNFNISILYFLWFNGFKFFTKLKKNIFFIIIYLIIK